MTTNYALIKALREKMNRDAVYVATLHVTRHRAEECFFNLRETRALKHAKTDSPNSTYQIFFYNLHQPLPTSALI